MFSVYCQVVFGVVIRRIVVGGVLVWWYVGGIVSDAVGDVDVVGAVCTVNVEDHVVVSMLLVLLAPLVSNMPLVPVASLMVLVRVVTVMVIAIMMVVVGHIVMMMMMMVVVVCGGWCDYHSNNMWL